MDERALEEKRREARRAVEEAGGGESEGFELAEQELIEHTSHGDGHTPARIMRDAAVRGRGRRLPTARPTRSTRPTDPSQQQSLD